MDSQAQISACLTRLHAASPSGFAIALHIRFTSPRYLFQSYDKAWLDIYTREGFLLRDPTVGWGFENTGSIRWSALAALDTAGVLTRAAGVGLRFGVCLALVEGGSRSIASFTHRDRELTDAEIADRAADLAELHRLTATIDKLSPQVHETLKQMSIYLTHG